jgi:hypothetical protein
MVTALVLLNVERAQIHQVAEQLADVPGISEVYSVAGRYDLVAVIRVKTNEALADLVTGKIRQVRGIGGLDVAGVGNEHDPVAVTDARPVPVHGRPAVLAHHAAKVRRLSGGHDRRAASCRQLREPAHHILGLAG